MELIQVGTNTYYLKNNTNIGIYKINETDIYIIDTGIDADCGKKILKVAQENNWIIKGIINTHSHADHIGGNRIIQERTKADIFANKIEGAYIDNPILEASMLYSAYPLKDLQNKFTMAEESRVTKTLEELPEGLKVINIAGHSPQMIGIKTSDEVYFLGDSLISTVTIDKYHVFYIYNVEEFLNTLDYLETLKGKLFIPAHTDAYTDISELINLNRKKVEEICQNILKVCEVPQTFEVILKKMFEIYNLKFNLLQYMLVGSSLKAYLSYLCSKNKLIYNCEDNQIWWVKVK